MKVIIVGGVAGGASCAARLRRLDEKAEIVMVERGPYVSYANCGLPYHIGGVIEKESSLLVATEQTFRTQFAIDVRTRCEVVGVSPKAKTVEMKNHATGEVTTEKYDKLVLSPGAAPIRPPLPGIDLPGIFSVRTVPDSREIREWIELGSSDLTEERTSTGFQPLDKAKRAVVVGGGYIGLDRLNTTSPVEPLWWKQAFQDPVLDRLVDEALAGNLTLRSVGLRVLQARQILLIAQGNLFPQEQFVGAAAAVVDPGAGAGSSGVYNLNFNLTWEIDVWGRIRRQIESASAAFDATLSSYDGVLVSLIGQVAQTYLLIRTTEQRLTVARKNVTYQEESVRISQAKFEAGETSGLDIEQARTLLFNTRALVPLLEQSLQQFKIALAILLGRLPQDLSELVDKPGPIPTVSPELAVGMPQDLIRRRPDIRTAERTLAAQSAQIGVAVSDLYPAFGLSGLIGPAVNTATGQVFSDLFNANSVAYNFGGFVRWNVFNYGRIEDNIRLQDATFQQLLEDYRRTVLQAQGEVESSLVAFFQSLLQLKELRQAADAAQRAAEISMEQYMDGLVDFNTVVSTLRTLATQQDQLASIQGTVAANLVEVYRSLGGGWEIRQSWSSGDLIPAEIQEEMRERLEYWPRKK